MSDSGRGRFWKIDRDLQEAAQSLLPSGQAGTESGNPFGI